MKKNYVQSLKKAVMSVFSALLYSSAFAQAPVVQTFSYTGTIVNYTVPACVNTVTMQAWGAQGGSVPNYTGGAGAYMSGVFSVTSGQVLRILIGGAGGDLNTSSCASGGGGGSFIALTGAGTPTPLLVAGGGGGRRDNVALTSTIASGVITTSAQPCPNTPGTGGSAGNGGTSSEPNGLGTGGPGGGFFTNGGPCGSPGGSTPGNSFINGGAIAPVCSPFTSGTCSFGGFGGGGAGCWCYRGTPGGGGGYSGGGAGSNDGAGGGGGSFNSGTNQNNIPGIRTGNGQVIISYFFGGSLAGAVPSPSAICVGGTSTLTALAGQVSYTWTPGGSNSSSITVSPIAPSVYTIQGTNAQGCISTATLAVSIDTVVPNLSVTTTATNVCNGKAFTAVAIGANSYTYTGGPQNGIPFIPTATSGYTVSGQNGCGITTATFAVNVDPLPNVTASVNNPTVCNGNPIILNGGGSVSGYTWSAGVVNNTAFVPPTSTNYTVTGIAANGCTASAVAGVTVLVTPNVPPVVTPTSVCLGVNATLTAIGATGYTWTPGLSLNSFSAAVSPTSSTTFTLFRSNGACTSTATVNLVINPLPFANATATPSLICAGDPVALNVIGGITYTWLPGGFTSANFTFYPNSSASYTATSSNGSCTATGVVQVSVNTSPVVGITSSTTTVCAGGNVTLTATGNASTYTWLPSNNNGNSIVVTPTAVSQYTLIGNNTANCSNRQTQLILVNAVPPLLLNSSVPFVCTGTTAVLSIANATVPGVTYSWSSNSGSGSTTNVSPTITTTYFASAVTNSTGCSSAGSLALTVNISTFVVSSPTAICRGNSATLVATGAANSYNWNVSGVGNTPSITVSPTLTTTYIVTGITGGCSNSVSVPLIVNLLPNVLATAVKPQICRLENGTVTATGANSYTWNNGANTTSITINSLTITTTFTVTGTDNNFCVKSNTVTQFVATCLGLETNGKNQDLGLSIFPNPNQGNFTISSEVDMNVSIVNALGQLVFNTQVLKDQQKDLALGNLPNGIYFIVAENNGIKVSKKIVIEK